MKKLSILLAGVCLTAALYGAGTIYGQNKTNTAKQKRRQSHNKQIPRRNDQRQSQRKSDKATSQSN